MSDYTPEHVETRAALYDEINVPETRDMLRAYAATLRQQAEAKAGVTDEVLCAAGTAFADVYEASFSMDTGTWNDNAGAAIRAALEAVWPQAALAQNTQGEAVGANVPCSCQTCGAAWPEYLLKDGQCIKCRKAVHAERAKDSTYPFESALAELIEAVDPSIESGDVIADAHAAALAVIAQNTQGEVAPSVTTGIPNKLPQSLGDHAMQTLAGAYTHAERATVPEQPQPMDTAPRDGQMLRLLVQFDEHATEDQPGPSWTIGANDFDGNGIDEWQFAGWCWEHDHFTEGKGTPLGWLPMLAERAPVPDAPLRVFSAGVWTYPETGQSFSAQEMDEAAFAVYRDYLAAAPSRPEAAA